MADSWNDAYELVKEYGMFGEGIDFCRKHPETVNNQGDHSGWTMLMQAAFWGVDSSVLQAFQDIGADPSLKNRSGTTAIEVARENSHHTTANAIESVFGCFEQDKWLLLGAAKAGDFAKVISLLNTRPSLINIQSPTGWGVLHQAALHGCPAQLFRRFFGMGACATLRTKSGETYLQVFENHHPGILPPSVQLEALTATICAGAKVLAFLTEKSRTGVVTDVKGEGAEEMVAFKEDGTNVQYECAAWRVQAALQNATDDPSEYAHACMMCGDVVYGQWSLGAKCQGNPHLMCGECTATWAWAKFTSQDLPITCSVCNIPCDLDSIPLSTTRTMQVAWEKVKPLFKTELNYAQFMDRMKEKNAQFLDVKGKIENTIELLENCGPLDHNIDYVDIAGTPAYRACPRCYIPIQHVSDCKHVICTGCNTDFCWLCTKPEEECPDWNYCAICVDPFTSAEQQIADLQDALKAEVGL